MTPDLRELDRKIAEALGHEFRLWDSLLTSLPAKALPATPCYSTSWEAMGELWVALRNRGIVMSLVTVTFAETVVRHEFCARAEWFTARREYKMDTAFSVSAPEAVANAALKAIGGPNV